MNKNKKLLLILFWIGISALTSLIFLKQINYEYKINSNKNKKIDIK